MYKDELAETLLAEYNRIDKEHFDGRYGKYLVGGIAVVDRLPGSLEGGYIKCQHGYHWITVSYDYYQQWGLQDTLEVVRHEMAHLVHRNHTKAFWALSKQLGAPRKSWQYR